MRTVAGWFGHSSIASSRGQTNPSQSIKLSTVLRSQPYVKADDSTSNLAEPIKSHTRHYGDYPHGEETVTHIRSSSVEINSAKGSDEGILVKYEVDLNYTDRTRGDHRV